MNILGLEVNWTSNKEKPKKRVLPMSTEIMNTNARICVKCRWHKPYERTDPSDHSLDSCVHPRHLTVDRVTGEKTYKPAYCENERRFDNNCGDKGKYFEPANMFSSNVTGALVDNKTISHIQV